MKKKSLILSLLLLATMSGNVIHSMDYPDQDKKSWYKKIKDALNIKKNIYKKKFGDDWEYFYTQQQELDAAEKRVREPKKQGLKPGLKSKDIKGKKILTAEEALRMTDKEIMKWRESN